MKDFSEEDEPILKAFLNIDGGIAELKNTDYVLVNENKMKFSVGSSGDDTYPAIAYKFIQNPQKIQNLDELFDVLEINRGTNTKYFIILNTGSAVPKDFSIQQKLFRKFFYENSSFIEEEAVFLEITDKRVAQKIGIDGEDMILVVQNENPYASLRNGEQFKLMNLPLEREFCQPLRQKTLENLYSQYLVDFTKKEFEEFLLSED